MQLKKEFKIRLGKGKTFITKTGVSIKNDSDKNQVITIRESQYCDLNKPTVNGEKNESSNDKH